MILELHIEDINLQTALANGAEAANMSVNDYALTMLTYSFNTNNATLAVENLSNYLVNELHQRIVEIQINSYATRHQVTNLHADLLGDKEQRALDIAAEANILAERAVFTADEIENEE